jgi:hypothetical protein
MFYKGIVILLVFVLSACGSGTTATGSAQQLNLEYSPAAAFVIPDLLACAGSNEISAVLRPTDFLDPQSIDMVIRLGESFDLSSPAYQIGTENILVVTNRDNPVNPLSAEQVRSLFIGRIQNWNEMGGDENPVQVWVFPSSEDIQLFFDESVLQGSPVTSFARVATSMDEMIRAITDDVNAVGILPGHWKSGDMETLFDAGSVPVLAILFSPPDSTLSGIITCLQ